MKVFDYSPIPFDGGKLSFKDRIKGILKFGITWVSEMKSQELIIEILNRVLDNRFSMLRNLPLPDGSLTIPLVLLGPHGVTVLNNSIVRGIYHTGGDSWKIMDNRINDYKPSKPNLIMWASQATQAFDTFITQAGRHQEMDGVLIFSDPGTHVTISGRADVRIILMDAIDRFGAQLLQFPQVMTMEDVRNLIEFITEALQPPDTTDERKRIIPYEQYLQFAQTVDSGFLQAIAPVQDKARFSRRQWALLWIFAIIDIIVLIGFVIYVLWTA